MPPKRQRPREAPALVAFGRQMRRMREAKGVRGQRVLEIQTKLHRWAGDDPHRRFNDLFGIEADAAMLVSWEPMLVTGLAQTRAYASALLKGNEEAVDARLERQANLTRDGDEDAPILSMLIDEQALYRQVGTAETMKEQLEHLIDLSMLPNVTAQVVLGNGEHNGNSGGFMVATMDDRGEVAYIETAIRAITTDTPADLSVLARTLVDLRSRTLTVEMSRELI